MKKIILLFVLFLFSEFSVAQSMISTTLFGKISAEYEDLDGITVYNLNKEFAVISEKKGYFSIVATEGDTIQFSAIQFKTLKYVVKKKDLIDANVQIKMQLDTNELKEVIVNEYHNINEVSLGIVPANQKKYTVAERRLYTAGELKPKSLWKIIAGGMDVDALINSFSGRTKRLKKELDNERKQKAIERLGNLFPDTFFTGDLKIPELYVAGFKYYAVENSKVTEAIASKNKTLLSFVLIEIAQEYNQTIKEK